MMTCIVEVSLLRFGIVRNLLETKKLENLGFYFTRQRSLKSTLRDQSSFPAPSPAVQPASPPPVERLCSFLRQPFDSPRSQQWLSRLSFVRGVKRGFGVVSQFRMELRSEICGTVPF